MNTDIGKARSGQILAVMNILAWVAFFAFVIQGGAILFSFIASFMDPDGARDLYKGLDLYALKQFSRWHYSISVLFMIAIAWMKAYVAYMAKQLLSQSILVNPFTFKVVEKLEAVSYMLFATWCVAMLNNAHVVWLMQTAGSHVGTYIDGTFIFMAGLVFLISQVFKRGVEIQSEQDLTV